MIELNDIETLKCVHAGITKETILTVTFGMSAALVLFVFARDPFYRTMGLISCVTTLLSYYQLQQLENIHSVPTDLV